MKSTPSCDENRRKNQSVIKRPTKPKKKNGKPSDDVSNGFIGVKLKRKRTKRFFPSGIAENDNERKTLAYLRQRNVVSTDSAVLKSRKRGRLSAKVHIPAGVRVYCCRSWLLAKTCML